MLTEDEYTITQSRLKCCTNLPHYDIAIRTTNIYKNIFLLQIKIYSAVRIVFFRFESNQIE